MPEAIFERTSVEVWGYRSASVLQLAALLGVTGIVALAGQVALQRPVGGWIDACADPRRW